MLLTHSAVETRGVRKRTIDRKMIIGPVSIKFISIILIAVAGLFYLAQTAQSSTKSYKVIELDQKIDQLDKQYEQLKVESVRLKSLNEIKSRAESMDLEPVDNVVKK
jgi:cell division protein FtsL